MGAPLRIDGIDCGRAVWDANAKTIEAAIAHAKKLEPQGRIVRIITESPELAARHGDDAYSAAAFLTVQPGKECMVCGGVVVPMKVTDAMLTAGASAFKSRMGARPPEGLLLDVFAQMFRAALR